MLTPNQIVGSFYFFFQEKQTAFVNILSPHTLFLLTRSSCCDVIKLSHFRPGGIARPGGNNEPKTAHICKRRKVKGLEIILIEKAINFI